MVTALYGSDIRLDGILIVCGSERELKASIDLQVAVQPVAVAD